MTIPFDNMRRIEDLERRTADQDLVIRGLEGRLAQAKGQRWVNFARTVRVYGDNYPAEDGSNTFPIVFCDREYTPTAGIQSVANLDRSANPLAVGTTVNGQWVMEDELVIALPAPPPPGTTAKGRWHLLPLKNYYWGILDEDLEYLGVADVAVHTRVGSNWVDSTFTQPVRDRLLTGASSPVEAGTWVKFVWETDAWIVSAAACGPPEA